MTEFYSREFQDTNTKCPRCKTEMIVGIGIDYHRPFNCLDMGPKYVDYEDLKLIECLKCPKCGHSDDLR